eukprot:m.115129 g.115129  ORF g.115129 m.115129 type:complete len:377 (+) comp12835_c0_seq2:2432-3562(+)
MMSVFVVVVLVLVVGLHVVEVVASTTPASHVPVTHQRTKKMDGVVGSKVDVFVAGEEGYYCIKIPDLVTTAKGSLLAFGEARVQNCSDYAETHLVMKSSQNNGRTWSPLRVVHRQSGRVIGNAAPVVLNTSRILLPHCRNNLDVFIMHSDDDGETWSTPRIVPDVIVNGSKWIGLGPPSAIQLRSGRIVIPGYYDNIGPHWDDGQLTHLYTIISDDLGDSWRIGAVLGNGHGDEFANENQVVELLNGTLLYNARTIGVKRYIVYSHDEGETYSDGEMSTDLYQPIDGCEGSTIRAPSNNTLYFTVPTTETLRYNLCLHESYDAGRSWSNTKIVDTGPSGYSSLSFLENGDLGLLYERSPDLRVVFVPTAISFVILG